MERTAEPVDRKSAAWRAKLSAWGRKGGEATRTTRGSRHFERAGAIVLAKYGRAHYVAMGKRSAQLRAERRSEGRAREAH